MKAELAAVQARLSDYTTFLVWATGTVPSFYFVLTSPAYDPTSEVGVCGTTDTVDAEVRVKAVTGTAEGVLTMLDNARAELSPGGASTALTVAGRAATVRFVRSEFVGVDDSTTTTATDRPKFVGVDTYRIVSQPA